MVNMLTELMRNHKEMIQKALANEIEVDFIHGIKIKVDKDRYAEFLEWKKSVSLPLEELGAIGGEFTYCITPTSLGSVYVVKHSGGEKFDLTNYDLW